MLSYENKRVAEATRKIVIILKSYCTGLKTKIRNARFALVI